MDILTIIANILIFLSGLITFACFGCFFKLINKVKTDPVKLPVKVYYIMAIILYITAVLAIWAAHTLKEESISPFSTLIALIICTVTAFNLLDMERTNCSAGNGSHCYCWTSLSWQCFPICS